jgi:hypothetical protein
MHPNLPAGHRDRPDRIRAPQQNVAAAAVLTGAAERLDDQIDGIGQIARRRVSVGHLSGADDHRRSRVKRRGHQQLLVSDIGCSQLGGKAKLECT